MDITTIAHKIEEKIGLLEYGRSELQGKAKAMAEAMGEYDRKIAIRILALKESGSYPATLIEKIAKGDCSNELVAMELAKAEYKLSSQKLQCVQAEMNGLQSINRHLESTG